ncbi:MAG: hypothetical protein ACWGHO_01725 [Candidatus Moraniibacteriota bacterium]
MTEERKKIGYTRVIVYLLATFLCISLYIGQIPFSGCRPEPGGYLTLSVLCESSAPSWVVFMANIPNKIILLPELLSADYNSKIFLLQFFLIGFLNFFLYAFVALVIVDVIEIKRHKVEIDKKVFIILFLSAIFLIFSAVAFFSWFILEIPSMISSLTENNILVKFI